MPAAWTTVRVFISSTFRDMHAERDHFVKVTFPRLRQWCAEHRLDFRGIDLRWGVPQAEANTSRVVEICLEEVDGCRPFFVCLLGGRYGKTIDQLPSDELLRFRGLQVQTQKSLTHLEIEHATWAPVLVKAREAHKPCDHAFFYFRKPGSIPSPESLKTYTQAERERHKETFFEVDGSERSRLLDELKHEILQRFGSTGNVFEYAGVWDPDATNWEDEALHGRLTKLDELGKRIEADLKQAIASRHADHFLDLAQPDALDAERFHHEVFVANRTQGYVPRRDVEAKLNDYVRDNRRRPLVVAGPPGSGKSSVLASWVMQHQTDADFVVLSRFVGASQSSTNLHGLLGRLCEELIRRFDLKDANGQSACVPSDPKKLRQQWPVFLNQAGRRGRAVVVIDALNQLDQSMGPVELDWLERDLPDGVRLILSVINDVSQKTRTESDWVSSLDRIGAEIYHLGLLTDEQCRDILRGMRRLWAKELDKVQVELLLDNPATQNPLFLLVALEELRVFGSFEKLTDEIRDLPKVLAGHDGIDAAVEQMFVRVLRRLEREEVRRAPGLVSALFRYLGSAREGLSESDLVKLLTMELSNLPDQARDDEMQVVMQQVQTYLMRKGSRTGAIVDFFHRSFWKSVQTYFLAGSANRRQTHSQLAVHFEGQDAFQGGLPNERRATELAWQRLRVLHEAIQCKDETEVDQSGQPLVRLFGDRQFFAAKSALGLTDEFVDECFQAYVLLGPERSHLVETLVQNLIGLLVAGEQNPRLGLSLGHVNAWLTYRNDTTLYEKLLAAGLNAGGADGEAEKSQRERLAHRCRSRLGGLRRRQGNLVEAEEHLRRVLPYWEREQNFKELATAEYEIAYLYFLRDRTGDAAYLFKQSADHAFQSADMTGGWISQCLYLRAYFLSGGISSMELKAELEKALHFFQEMADRSSPDAMRWVWNAKAHLFEAAFCNDDEQAAEHLLRALCTDAWIKEHWEKERGPDWSYPFEARMAMMKEDWPRAIRFFEEYLERAKGRKAGESFAREHLDFGISCAEAGQAEKARKAWCDGLNCADERRNGMWKDAIREAQGLFETTGQCWTEWRTRLKR